ncbi:MAG: PDZ domain-containing protein, partial [Clostridia bacterium]|nr:PDZ domain-containing protein [Clostridia bacterium]
MKKILALMTAIVMLSQTIVFAAPKTEDKEIEKSVEYQALELLSGYIADRYIDSSYTSEDIMMLGISKYLEENGDEALVAIIKSALHSLDDYSDFYTRQEYIDYTNSINRTFYGLGVTLQQVGEYVEIVSFVEENGLAQKSGFMLGDRFYEVDGVNVVGYSITEVRNLVVGELGTTVDIKVLRNGEIVSLVGTRTAVNTSTVAGGVLEGDIGYIQIAS